MGVDHPGLAMSLDELLRTVKRQTLATIQNAAIGHAGLRVHDGGWIRIENGGLSITGDGIVSGTFTVTGSLSGSGTLDWTGPVYLRGTTQVYGSLIVSGPTQLNNTLTVAAGLIKAGAVTITPSSGGAIQVGNLQIDGSLGGTISSSGTVYIQGSGTPSVRVTGMLSASDLLVLGKITAGELDVVGPKNFRMEHPTKPNHWLRHGSTESPVSGTEYTGRAALDASGEAVVELPDYFEALNKADGRSVHITPVGRPFPVGADDVADGRFTAYGDPGREVFWLVKAERFGGDFLLEEQIPDADDDQGA